MSDPIIAPSVVATSEPIPARVRDSIEKATAAAIVERDKAAEQYDGRHWLRRMLAGHANGLMAALRLLGGYEGATFSSDWARGVLSREQGRA